MKEQNDPKDHPEVYAICRNGADWQISRRDFLKAAGMGAAAVSVGMSSGCSRPKPFDMICGDVTAHTDTITGMTLSADGRYLLSLDKKSIIKCWDFESQALLGSIRQTFGHFSAGYYNGRSCLFLSSGGGKYACAEIPITEHKAKMAAAESLPIITLPEADAAGLIFDSAENIYTGGHDIRLYRKSDDYQQPEVLFSLDPEKYVIIKSMKLFNDEKSLFFLWNQHSGFEILDLESKGSVSFRKNLCTTYAILPDQKQALICSEKGYALTSLEDGAIVWKKTGPQPGGGKNYRISAAAVTPDGSTGIIIVVYNQQCYIYLVSLTDGSETNKYELGYLVRSDSFAGPVLTPDGTKAAVSVDKTIFFFSLPELKLIGCPIDVDDAKDNEKGIEISATDEATGETYTYSMPCGAAIPGGAVCTCNCVKGRGGCACNAHSSSNSKNKGGSGPHYWHPN